MEPLKRMSMNTSLKNARIFDDDAWAWDETEQKEKYILQEKNKQQDVASVSNTEHSSCGSSEESEEGEIEDSISETSENNTKVEIQNQHSKSTTVKIENIKKESTNSEDLGSGNSMNDSESDDTFEESEGSKSCIKQILKNEFSKSKINAHVSFQSSPSEFVQIKVKKEPESPKRKSINESMEEGELEDSICDRAIKKEATPPSSASTKIKVEPSDFSLDFPDKFNESPYSKELLEKLKLETPVKAEAEDSNESTKSNLKSAKRSVFSRHSPYKKPEDNSAEKRVSAKSRLGPKVDDSYMFTRRRKMDNLETDPSVLARREKQIAYGKNTIGYDNYSQMIPKHTRTKDDPQTPDKFKKYSRRGWDGLIRQWRLKLHKFDPPSENEMNVAEGEEGALLDCNTQEEEEMT